MKTYSNILIAISVFIAASFETAVGQIDQAQTSSVYYQGSTVCGDLDFGLKLALHDNGAMHPDDFNDPCRSYKGRCNTRYATDFENTRYVRGTLKVTKRSNSIETVIETIEVVGKVLRRNFEGPALSFGRFGEIPNGAAIEINTTYELDISSKVPFVFGSDQPKATLFLSSYFNKLSNSQTTMSQWDVKECTNPSIHQISDK